MVRIEIKKVAEGQVALGMEAKEETPDEVLMCAARGFVGVARNLLGPMATNPQFAEEISRGIKGMLLDTEDLKVTRGVEGKEAKFIAALYGMNPHESAAVCTACKPHRCDWHERRNEDLLREASAGPGRAAAGA